MLSNIKQFYAENPKASIIGTIITTVVCYGLYKAVCLVEYQSHAQHIVKTLPRVSNFPYPLEFSEDEQHEIATFVEVLRNRAGLKLINFELPVGIPDCLRKYCTIYEEETIPAYMHDIIRQAVHNVGISEPIFFYQTTYASHANSKCFNRIGLHPKHFAYLNPIFKKASIPVAIHAKDSLRTLYHELCHIKGQHSNHTFPALLHTLIEDATDYAPSSQAPLNAALKKISHELDALSEPIASGELFVDSVLTEISTRVTYIEQKKSSSISR